MYFLLFIFLRIIFCNSIRLFHISFRFVMFIFPTRSRCCSSRQAHVASFPSASSAHISILAAASSSQKLRTSPNWRLCLPHFQVPFHLATSRRFPSLDCNLSSVFSPHFHYCYPSCSFLGLISIPPHRPSDIIHSTSFWAFFAFLIELT